MIILKYILNILGLMTGRFIYEKLKERRTYND